MTERKHEHKEAKMPEQGQTGGDGAPEKALAESISVEELELLRLQLEETSQKSAEYLDGWQRTQAEFMNYKKRLERDNAAFREIARGDVIRRFLPVVDDLERALANRPSDTGPWVDGIELVYRKLLSILDSEGLVRIEAEGKIFDPNLHEAISQEPNEDFESGQVIAVVQQGYMLGERVIRHAMVRVAA